MSAEMIFGRIHKSKLAGFHEVKSLVPTPGLTFVGTGFFHDECYYESASFIVINQLVGGKFKVKVAGKREPWFGYIRNEPISQEKEEFKVYSNPQESGYSPYDCSHIFVQKKP